MLKAIKTLGLSEYQTEVIRSCTKDDVSFFRLLEAGAELVSGYSFAADSR